MSDDEALERWHYDLTADFFYDNQRELMAVTQAEEGDYEPLADLVMETGVLRTGEARRLVSRYIKNLPRERRQWTLAQRGKDVAVYARIRELQTEHNCSEYKACGLYLDEHPDRNEDTLKSQIKRAKKTLEYFIGRPPTPIG